MAHENPSNIQHGFLDIAGVDGESPACQRSIGAQKLDRPVRMNTKDAQKLAAVVRKKAISKEEIARVLAIGFEKEDASTNKLRADGHTVPSHLV